MPRTAVIRVAYLCGEYVRWWLFGRRHKFQKYRWDRARTYHLQHCEQTRYISHTLSCHLKKIKLVDDVSSYFCPDCCYILVFWVIILLTCWPRCLTFKPTSTRFGCIVVGLWRIWSSFSPLAAKPMSPKACSVPVRLAGFVQLEARPSRSFLIYGVNDFVRDLSS